MPFTDAEQALTTQLPDYQTYRNYLLGNHTSDFATPKFKRTYSWIIEQAQENLCPAVVSAFTDGLHIDSYGDEAANQLADEQGLEALLPLVWREAFTCGDSYVLVWPNPAGELRPRFHQAHQIIPQVDPDNPDNLLWAAKKWATPIGKGKQINKLTIYYPDHVERYATTRPVDSDDLDGWSMEQEWALYDGDGDDATFAHNFDAVPIVWFKHEAHTQTGHGRSVLADVIPIQDEHNKAVADLIVASERIARPIRYVLQAMPDTFTTPAGKPTAKFDETWQNILALTAGSAGQFPDPNAQALINVQNHSALKIARVTGIPAFWFTQTSGDVPSGEALMTLSTRRLSAVQAFQRDNTPALRGLMQLLGIENPIITWRDPMPLSQAEKLAAASVKKTLGYALPDIVAGLDESDPDGIVQRATHNAADLGQAFRNGYLTYED